MIKILFGAMLTTAALTIMAILRSPDMDDFEKAMEDEEQLEFLAEWRRRHGKG